MGILERRFRKSLRKRVRRGFRGYPVATVAYYGPDDQRASKVAVGIANREGQEVAELRRWFSETGDVRFDPVINRQMVEFIEAHAVRTVSRLSAPFPPSGLRARGCLSRLPLLGAS